MFQSVSFKNLLVFGFFLAYPFFASHATENKPRTPVVAPPIHHSESVRALVPRIKHPQRPPAKPLPPVEISPTISQVEPKTPTYFSLSRVGDGLVLKFVTKNPNFQLFTQESLFIQMTAEPPLQVEPNFLLKSDWPKNATQKNIVLKGATGFKGVRTVVVKASYTYCDIKTKACTNASSTFNYEQIGVYRSN